VGHYGPNSSDYVDIDAGKPQWYDNVAKKYRRINIVTANGLKGDFSGHFRPQTRIKHGHTLAESPILG
jgi:hypothetical protein